MPSPTNEELADRFVGTVLVLTDMYAEAVYRNKGSRSAPQVEQIREDLSLSLLEMKGLLLQLIRENKEK